ncbi:flagellar motor switch protein FliN [Bordetella sp. N]|uniref:flagellar motor switch protein FliN n=1 Tax=Bordetella sp. N TaxID=1746199 RepID=UPI00070D23D9|nr:flagellar motor switch protein FliN [Bordetella sp. N]ALM83181.1 flagellar motor switch protein FliN [Bordetella sp. N]
MTDPNDQAGGTSPSASGADDWADALAEQSNAATQSQADGLKAAEDPWAAAMAEQSATTSAAPSPAPQSAAKAVFKPLSGSGEKATTDIDLIMDVPVQMTVELGRTRLTIKNLLQLGQGSVVELDGLAGEPMDIFVNGYLIAQGEVVVVDDKYGIRLTDIITPSERINRLNGRR